MQDFNAPNELYAAVKANDVAKAEELLKAGAKPDSRMLAIALDDKFAIQQRAFSVCADDLLMAKLLLRHGADINGNRHEAIIAAFSKPSVLAMMLVADIPGRDLWGALKSIRTLPQYKGPDYDLGRLSLKSWARMQDGFGTRLRRSLKAARAKFTGGPKP